MNLYHHLKACLTASPIRKVHRGALDKTDRASLLGARPQAALPAFERHVEPIRKPDGSVDEVATAIKREEVRARADLADRISQRRALLGA